MDLKQCREVAGLTQLELARRVGCSKRRVSWLERGIEEMSEGMEARMVAGLAGRPHPGHGKEDPAIEEWFHELWIERYCS